MKDHLLRFKNRFENKYVECFGDFCLSDAVCRKYCALRLRCAIEQKEQIGIEQLEDLFTFQEIPLKIQ